MVSVRPADAHYDSEVCTTLNTSRAGFYFETSQKHYFPGMIVHFTRNFRASDPMNREERGDVVRVEKLDSGKWGVAVRVLKAGSRMGDSAM